MFGKPKSKTFTTSASMKKKAPPRPPPPAKSTNIPRSASIGFDPWNEHKSKAPQIQRTQTMGCSYNIANRSDLIDLSSPSNSPPKLTSPLAENYPGATSNEVPDFKYHIGASIFYVKSELKATPGGTKPTANPFSPPRPSPQSLLSKTKSVSTVPANKQPTVIKANTQMSESLNNNNNYGSSTSQGKAQPVLLDWDEPPRKIVAPPPTVIRPIPPPKKPGLASIRLPDRNSVTSGPPSFVPPPVSKSPVSRYEVPLPRYEEPPEEESDDDFDDSFDLNAVPEPAEPPPPPPQDLSDYDAPGYGIDQSGYSSKQHYVPDAADRSYGIALYDYVSGEPGDLQFAAGDVIYLIRTVDESWLFGCCGSYEGMFPANFINIVVPLEGGGGDGGTYPESNSSNEIQSAFSTNDIYTESLSYPTHYIQVLHGFEAQEPSDLAIRDGDIVTVIGQVNEDWLYGELNGRRGQFPASFLEYVPGSLKVIDPKTQ